jgi:predicted ATPase
MTDAPAGDAPMKRAPRYMMTIHVAAEKDAADRLITFVDDLREQGITVEVSGPPSTLVLADLTNMRGALERRLEREPDDVEALELLDRVSQAEGMQRFIQRFVESQS